jgi:hypothetical protein
MTPACPDPLKQGLEDVGWPEGKPGAWKALLRRRRRRIASMYWFNPRVFIEARNDQLVRRYLSTFVERRRSQWLEAIGARGFAGHDDRVLRPELSGGLGSGFSFLLLGDTGDRDGSQYAVAEAIRARAEGTAFMIIASDVVYPAGGPNNYPDALYLPYRDYRRPIYAIPGNHDWYDGLSGFMYHFCRLEDLPLELEVTGAGSLRRWVLSHWLRFAWNRAAIPDERLLRSDMEQRGVWAQPVQPAPYFAIDTPELLILALDTGIHGRLDAEQGRWLIEASEDPRPKLLITGKPVYVDNHYNPCPISWDGAEAAGGFQTVDDVVRHEPFRYRAVIGADVHNYQYYPIELGHPPRCINYIVSGGGGAHLSATHLIAPIDLRPRIPQAVLDEISRLPTEDDFVSYPRRGDSLARMSRVFAGRLRVVVLASAALAAGAALGGVELWDSSQLGRALGAFLLLLLAVVLALPALYLLSRAAGVLLLGGRVDPDQAASWVAEELGQRGLGAQTPSRVSAQRSRPSWLTRRRLGTLLPKEHDRRAGPLYGPLVSPFFDVDDPPLFRHFLRVEVSNSVMRIQCYGVTGWREHEEDPPLWHCIDVSL